MTTLGTYGYVTSDDREYEITGKSTHFIDQLDMFDQHAIYDTFDKFGAFSQDELLRYIYVKYPFFAINSTIAAKLLSKEELDKVQSQRRNKSDKKLFSIGYEGVSLEEFINKLIIEDVHVLCDVRKNAFSQKYGFSKSQLEKACLGVGIKYIHVPELGIESDKRQCLKSQKDYDNLFNEYEQTVLPYQTIALNYVRNLIIENSRVALTCFEKDPKQCHRTRVAKALMKLANGEYTFYQIIF